MAPDDRSPRDEYAEVATGEGPGIDTGAPAHPFGGDTHPMHEWDVDTRTGVREWHEALRAEVHGPRLEAAAAMVRDIEIRLANGDPVGSRERDASVAEYKAAILEYEHNEGKLRTLAVRTPDSFDQTLAGEPVFDGWKINETNREQQIAQLNADAAAVAHHLPTAGTPAAQSPEA